MKFVFRVMMGLWAAAISLQGADVDSGAATEERLQKLEQQMEGLRLENRELRRQLGLEGSTNAAGVVKPGGKSYDIKLGGMIQAHGEFGDPGDARWTGAAANDRFYVRRARVQVYGKFLEQFSYRLQGDFAGALGETSGQRASLTDGWVGWDRYNFATLRLGQYFPTYGWEKRLNPLALDVVELTLPGIKLLPERQLGAQMAGGWLSNRVGYVVGVFNGNNLNNNFNDSDNFMVVPRLQGTPLRGKIGGQPAEWNLGLSGYYSDDARVSLAPEFNLPGQNYYAGLRLGLDLDTQLRIGPFDLWAEYMRTDFDPTAGADYLARGWYVQAGYFFLPKWQGVVQYQEYDPSDAAGGNTTRSWTFGLNYCLRGDDLMVSLNYLLMDVPEEQDLQNKVLVRLQAGF